MNTKVEHNQETASPADLARYALAIALVVGGLFVFYWFEQWPGGLRGLTVAASVAAALGVMALTARGRQAREFISESVFELRKVVWPTREEAMRTTGVVLLVVAIVSLLLAGFDVVISWLIRLVLGN